MLNETKYIRSLPELADELQSCIESIENKTEKPVYAKQKN